MKRYKDGMRIGIAGALGVLFFSLSMGVALAEGSKTGQMAEPSCGCAYEGIQKNLASASSAGAPAQVP